MHSKPTVFLIDDDPEVRRSLRWLLHHSGHSVETFRSAEEFLEEFDPDRPGCVVADLRMPGLSGLELLGAMKEQAWRTPVIIVTGYGDVSTAVRTLEIGACAFIEKPFDSHEMLRRVGEALERDALDRRERLERDDAVAHAAKLTPRQVEVMRLIVAGKSTKQIAGELRISARTVEKIRAAVMKKMGAESLAQLVATAVRHGLA